MKLRQLCHLLLSLLALGTLGLPALAQTEPEQAPTSEQARLQQIKQAQARLQASDVEARRACHQQFAINDCLQAQRLRHQAEMQPLQRERDAIESSLRRARAEAQRERVRQRQLEFAASEGERRTESLLYASDPASAPRNAATRGHHAQGQVAAGQGAAASAARAPHQSPGVSAQARQRQAEQSARQHAEKRAEMEARLKAHQAQVRQRQEARSKPPAAPLPVPTAAQIAASLKAAPAASAAVGATAASAANPPR